VATAAQAVQAPPETSNESNGAGAPEPSPRRANLLAVFGGRFFPHQWDQRRQLNSTAYASTLALSIDASAAFGRPTALDPDSTSQAQVTADKFVQNLNRRGYIERRSNPHRLVSSPASEGRQRQPLGQVSIQRIPNGGDTRDAIKAAIDTGHAVVFTYNFTLGDCSSRAEFFRLKFNLADDEVYPDNSSYDTLYDGEHTMCIVGYDDGDGTFIVHDSRGVRKRFRLPGLAYVDSNAQGTVRIPQSLAYTDFLYRSNALAGTYRHEFFVLAPQWVNGDAQPPAVDAPEMDADAPAVESSKKLGHSIWPWPYGGNLVETYLHGPFDAENWNQRWWSNCTAYGSLVAASVHASISKGGPIVLDPDSTLSGGSTVPNYIASLNNRGYLNDWGKGNAIDKLINRHAFSSIGLQQIGNDNGAKQAIRTAIDNKQPVVFRLRHWKQHNTPPYSIYLFDTFWYNKSEDDIFTDINDPANEADDEGHVMCIIGYDDSDGTFIVQNSWGTNTMILDGRPNGTLKIPQNLVYDKWHYYSPLLPFIGGEYRFGFYKLAPQWITNDTEPPTVSIPQRPTQISEHYAIYTVYASDNIKATDVEIKVVIPGATPGKDTLYSQVRCEVSDGEAGIIVRHSESNATPKPKYIDAVFTVTAYDSSGNVSETSFTRAIAKDWFVEYPDEFPY